jgi:hypothetical protein
MSGWAPFDARKEQEHASKAYVPWAENDMSFRRCQLNSAINDTLAELDRRGVSA